MIRSRRRKDLQCWLNCPFWKPVKMQKSLPSDLLPKEPFRPLFLTMRFTWRLQPLTASGTWSRGIVGIWPTLRSFVKLSRFVEVRGGRHRSCVRPTCSWRPKMWTDPIVEEIRQIKREIAAECNYDLGELCRRLKAEELASGRTFVSYSPRPVVENPTSAGPAMRDCGGNTCSPSPQTADNDAGKLPAA